MQSIKFPYIAIIMGLFFMVAVTYGSQPDGAGNTLMPLLALLAISELAFFMCAFGAWFGYKDLKEDGLQPVMIGVTGICVAMALAFGWLGIKLWPL